MKTRVNQLDRTVASTVDVLTSGNTRELVFSGSNHMDQSKAKVIRDSQFYTQRAKLLRKPRGTSKSMTVAVLFDLEDTLVKTPWSDCQHVIEFRHQTRATLTELGISPTVLEGTERATIMRNKAEKYAEQKFSKERLQQFHQKMEAFLSSYEVDSAVKSTVFPDTINALKQLRAQAVPMAIVTNTSAKAATIMLKRHDLKAYFDLIVTREDVRQLKPDPEGILLAARALKASKCFMVGDLVLDAIAAKNAGAVSIVVNREQDGNEANLKGLQASDFQEAERYMEEKKSPQADYVVCSLIEIPPLIAAEQRKT